MQVLQDRVLHLLDRGDGAQPGLHRLRNHVREVGVHPHREARRVRGLGELVQHLPDRQRLGVDEVERVARQVVRRQVRDVVQSARHEVHRHDVHLLALGTRQREPLGQRVPQALDQLEEVVGPVDLVHLARDRVAHHDPGAVDAEWRVDPLPDELLGLVLGRVVRVGQLLALVEHVLAEEALELPGNGDRAGVVEGPDLDRVRELDHVAGAVHVRPLHGLLVGLHVVDRADIFSSIALNYKLALNLLGLAIFAVLFWLTARRGATDRVCGMRVDRHKAIACSEALSELVQPAARALPDQGVDRAIAPEQKLHEVPPDESGRARYEVVHARAPCDLPGARVYPSEGG